MNLLEKSGYDAIRLAKLVTRYFPSFMDISRYQDKDVFFFKRAQILANDLSYLKYSDRKFTLSNLDQLTAFADYKLPQRLQALGILVYSRQLSQQIDNQVIIPSGSTAETEIRSATIWGVELIRQRMQTDQNCWSACQIDNALWLLSQDHTAKISPYHRTYTIYY